MSNDPKLLDLTIYINEHLHSDLPLRALAARVGLSPFHFHRKFRAAFGESLHQHIKRLRLERASHELLHHLKPVETVGLHAGYKTVSAFSHAFAQYAQKDGKKESPTRYRQRMIEDVLPRTRRTLHQKFAAAIERLQPSRVVTLAPQPLVFWRSATQERDFAPVCSQLDAVRTVATESARDGAKSTFYAVTSDVHGATEGGLFRIDIGLATDQLPEALRVRHGQVTIPGGRYAVFDLDVAAEDVIDFAYAAYLFWLPNSSEQPRSSAHFVSFESSASGVFSNAQLYLPLQG